MTAPLLFYILLLINSFFSIKFFLKIIPRNTFQNIIDVILIIFYILIALNLGNGIFFTLYLAMFFALAVLKYTRLLNLVNQPKLLRRKITANTLGILLALAAYFGILNGYETVSLWAMTIVFAVANVYYLFVKPLYRRG